MFIKTDYSILTSLLKTNDLVNFLKEKGITTIGIVDDNLSYVMEYYNELKKNNIKSWQIDKEETEKQIFKLNDSINNIQKEKVIAYIQGMLQE